MAATEAEMHTPEETKVTRLQRGYLPILRFGLRQPFLTLAMALVVFVATLGAATLLKTDFLGSVTDQTTLAIHQKLPPGTRLSTTSTAAEQVENILQCRPAGEELLGDDRRQPRSRRNAEHQYRRVHGLARRWGEG